MIPFINIVIPGVGRSTRYQAVPSDKGIEDESKILDEDLEIAQKLTARRKIFKILSIAFIAAVVTIILLAIFQAHWRVTVIDQCGYTPEEARKLGCKYEITSFSWVPDECYDPQTEAECLASRPWQFWRDINATEEVSLEEVRLGEAKGFYVEWEFHTGHCGYLFKKLHRAVKRGGKVDSYISDLEHTDHCIKFMLNPPDSALNAWQFTFRKYPLCGRDGPIGVEIPKQAP